MSAHFDLAALDMLVAVVESGGFTAAGARLGRTQSAISVRIQDLEAQLGHKLLERSRRGVVPTHAGERLIGADAHGSLRVVGRRGPKTPRGSGKPRCLDHVARFTALPTPSSRVPRLRA